jgi:protein ImuA
MQIREHRPDDDAAALEEFAFVPGGIGALTAEVLHRIAARPGPVLWAQDYASRRESGRPCWAGVARMTPRPVLYVAVGRPVDVLRVMEEGASCQNLAAVIGEIHGLPKVLDFVATKRLRLRAGASRVPVLLVRSENTGLSAARNRWRITPLPSARHSHDAAAPGSARWRLELLRARDGRAGIWIAGHDGLEREDGSDRRAADHLALVSRPGDGTLAQDSSAAGGQASR